MKNFGDIVVHVLQGGMLLATFMVIALLFMAAYQLEIQPLLQEWRESRQVKAKRACATKSASAG